MFLQPYNYVKYIKPNTVSKLFVLDKNTWNNIALCKLYKKYLKQYHYENYKY